MVSFGWVHPSISWATIYYPEAFTVKPVVYHEIEGTQNYGNDNGVKDVTSTSFKIYQNLNQSWLAIGF